LALLIACSIGVYLAQWGYVAIFDLYYNGYAQGNAACSIHNYWEKNEIMETVL
jgi:hypothetical protein